MTKINEIFEELFNGVMGIKINDEDKRMALPLEELSRIHKKYTKKSHKHSKAKEKKNE